MTKQKIDDKKIEQKAEKKPEALTYTLGIITYVTLNTGVQAMFPANMTHDDILKAVRDLYQCVSENQQRNLAVKNAGKMSALLKPEKAKESKATVPAKNTAKAAKKKK